MGMTAAERFVKRMLAPEVVKEEELENEEVAVSPEGETGDTVKAIEENGEEVEQGEKAQRESALEAALNYLEREGEDVERNPFSKGWAIKEGNGKDGNPIQQISSEKGVKDELYEALVADEALPDGQTLQEHDKRHHPKGFNPETDTCKFRERLATETETDKGDILDKDKSSGSKETSGGPQIKAEPVRIGRGLQIPLVKAFKGVKDKSGQLRYVSLVINEDPGLEDGDIRVQYDDSLSGAMFLYVKDPDSIVKTVYNENGTYHHGELLVDKIENELKKGLAHFAEKVEGAESQEGEETHSEETSNGIVSPEDDRKYLDAVERGDIKIAQKMVDAAAKRYFGDSAVLGKVWHNTKKKFTEFKNSFPNVFFFAKDKKWAEKFGSDERYSGKENTKAYYLDIQKPIDMRAEKSGKDWLSYFAEQGVDIGENGKNKLERFGDRVIPGYAILNHDSSEPYGTGFRDAMVKAGFDGAILEDIKRGTADRTSYGAFNSTGIKSADAVTYDDNGKVIPLSRRFDKGTDIRGDISGNQSEQRNGKAEQDNTRVYEGLSNKQVKKYKDLMAKKHPELDAELILTELGKIKDRKIQGDAFAWVMRGAVKLPEDLYKVEQARELATKAKKDPLSYNTPQDCINQLMGSGHKVKEKPITVEELKKNPLMSDYRDEGYGVETFQVEDSREGQQLMRKVLNTHWGKDANPWCLLHGDGEGNLSDGSDGGYDAWKYWNHYNALPKRVAFKDGKLLAFMATHIEGNPDWHTKDWDEFDDGKWVEEYNKAADSGYEASMRDYMEENHPEVVDRYENQEQEIEEQWWDRKDEPHSGIPLGDIAIPEDEFNRRTQGELVSGHIIVPQGQRMYVGRIGEPGYKAWTSQGYIIEEVTEDGDQIDYRGGEPPIPHVIKRTNGDEEMYNAEGNLTYIANYGPDGNVIESFSWDKKKEDGSMFLKEHKDVKKGIEERWYPNGNRQFYSDSDCVTEWHPNGYIKEKTVDVGNGNNRRFQWDKEGKLLYELKEEEDSIITQIIDVSEDERKRFNQDNPDPQAFDKPPEVPRGLWDEMKEKEDKTVSDELVSALMWEREAEDEKLSGGTLQEHDRHYHKEGYKEGDRCSVREELMEELAKEPHEDVNIEPEEEIKKNYIKSETIQIPRSIRFIKDDIVVLPTDAEFAIFSEDTKQINEIIEIGEQKVKEWKKKRGREEYKGFVDKLCRDGFDLAVKTANLLGFRADRTTGRFNIESRKGINKETVENLAALLSMFPGIKQDGPFFVWEKEENQRATTGLVGMNISRNAKFRTYIHEAAHWIEFNSDEICNKCKDFLKYRTQGEPYIHVGPQRDKEIKVGEYKGMKVNEVPITREILLSPKWEIGKKDKFYHPYCGKMYFQAGSDEEPEVFGTEILSMGMEALFAYPEKFIRKDEEYARFIIGILRGIK